jgi:hypothetical protein
MGETEEGARLMTLCCVNEQCAGVCRRFAQTRQDLHLRTWPFESDVALRLPPHSTTLLCDADFHAGDDRVWRIQDDGIVLTGSAKDFDG